MVFTTNAVSQPYVVKVRVVQQAKLLLVGPSPVASPADAGVAGGRGRALRQISIAGTANA